MNASAKTSGGWLPDSTPLLRQNDTRDGLDLDQDEGNIRDRVELFRRGLKEKDESIIRYAHEDICGNADFYTAVWDALHSWERTEIRRILAARK